MVNCECVNFDSFALKVSLSRLVQINFKSYFFVHIQLGVQMSSEESTQLDLERSSRPLSTFGVDSQVYVKDSHIKNYQNLIILL